MGKSLGPWFSNSSLVKMGTELPPLNKVTFANCKAPKRQSGDVCSIWQTAKETLVYQLVHVTATCWNKSLLQLLVPEPCQHCSSSHLTHSCLPLTSSSKFKFHVSTSDWPSWLTVKSLPAMWETQVWSLGWEDPLEKEMVTHSSILAWKSHGQRNLAGYNPWGSRESDMTEQLHFLFFFQITSRSWATGQDPASAVQENICQGGWNDWEMSQSTIPAHSMR